MAGLRLLVRRDPERKIWGRLHDFFHYSMVPAYHAALRLLPTVTERFQPPQQREVLQTIVGLAVRRPAEVARAEVDLALARKGQPVQYRLARACQMYERMSVTLETLLPIALPEGDPDDLVASWKEADRYLRGWLHDLLAEPDFATFRTAIERVGGIRATIPEPARRTPEPAAAAAATIVQVPGPSAAPAEASRRATQVTASDEGTRRRDETKIDAVVPLTLRDFERFSITRRSLALFFKDLGTCWVVAPDGECAALRARIPDAQYEVVPESSIIPELKFYNVIRRLVSRSHRPTGGWIVQQLIKLAIAERVQTEFYLTLDSDVICTKPVTHAQLIREGRAICRMRRADVIDQWPQWYDDAERLLGLPRSGINRGVTPALLSTEAVLQLHTFLANRVSGLMRRLGRCLPEHSGYRDPLMSWRSYLLRNLPWTEYSLYDTFVEGTGRFQQYHSEDERTTLSGNSVWYQFMWSTWKPERSFTARDDFYFSVVQSNQGFSVEQVWEKVRPYLIPEPDATVAVERIRTGNDVRNAGKRSPPGSVF